VHPAFSYVLILAGYSQEILSHLFSSESSEEYEDEEDADYIPPSSFDEDDVSEDGLLDFNPISGNGRKKVDRDGLYDCLKGSSTDDIFEMEESFDVRELYNTTDSPSNSIYTSGRPITVLKFNELVGTEESALSKIYN